VACPGPSLSVASVSFSPATPQPGDRVEISVTLQNSGRDPATGVHGDLSFDAAYVTVVDGAQRWPDLAPDATAASTPFVVQLAPDAPTTQSGCGPMIAPAGDQPVSSGSDTPAGSSGSSGTSTGSAGGATIVEPSGVMTASPATASPASAEPMPADVPPDASPPQVTLDGTLAVAASGHTFSLAVGNVVACMYASGAEGGIRKGGPALEPRTPGTGDTTLAATRTHDARASRRSTPVALALLLLAAIASVFGRYRFGLRATR
ncbi:MAG: hypothetical protein LC663_03965, partial [Actinobacteria bacterium]|nr:hypothetical protein [Actinomycetota bacterium]